MLAGLAAAALLGLIFGLVGAGSGAATPAPVVVGGDRTDAGVAGPGSAWPSSEAAAAAPAPPRAATRVAPRRLARPDVPEKNEVPRADRKEKIEVPRAGPGRFVRARVTVPATGRRGRLIRYDVRVERGLRLDPERQARIMQRVLSDRRSWRGSGRWRFALVRSAKKADVHVYLTTPQTTDALCAPLRTLGKVSCQTGDRVVLNARRWVFGADSYGEDLTRYRQYLVNHEFGHVLGFSHVGCLGDGRRAPVMLQQTKGLQGCRANPWPAPRRGR